jgi:two-component system, LytTR family, sensor histidine kinase AlgZ
MGSSFLASTHKPPLPKGEGRVRSQRERPSDPGPLPCGDQAPSRIPYAADPGTEATVTLLLDTLRALLHPRRSIPIAVVSVPLLFAQWQFSGQNVLVEAIAVLMVATFVLLGPYSWRALFPPGRSPARHPLRLLLYVLIGATPTTLGNLLPALLSVHDSFLTRGMNTFVIAAMFWVGGWGLARDIDLEQGLDRERQRAERLGREAERAQLLAMKAHLDPHFLFNTLNAIAEWCQEDPAVAERAILQLSSILREVLGGIGSAGWALRRELDLVRDVWALHHLRDPSWFTVEWQVDPAALDVPVPPLVLLPLVENAVKHGPARGHHGPLKLQVTRAGEVVRIGVSNPGPFAGPRAGGTGLDVVRKRLDLAYAGRARFTIGPVGDDTVAEVSLPTGGPDGWVA